MKQFRLYAIFFMLGVLTLVSCGGGGGGGDSTPTPIPTPPKTYTQSETIAAAGGDKVVTLTSLSSSISSINNTTSWVVASPQSYTSGSPKLQLNVTANTDKNERKCEIIVTAQSGENVVLTVIQQAGNGIDDLHDNTTTQPAYSPSY